MIRFLPVVIELTLLIFCVIDILMSRDQDLRNLPKWAWLLIVILIPLVGAIAWLIAGRPLFSRRQKQEWAPGSGFPETQRPMPATGDIDERLAAELERADRQHDEALRRWQADLEERERKLRESADGEEPA